MFGLDAMFDHLFVSIERGSPGLDFQEHYLIQISFWKSIQNQVIDSFSQKHEILVGIREIGQQRRYFFMDMTKHDIAWSGNCIASVFFYFEHKINSRDEISHKKSENNTYDNESEIRIHAKLLNW